MRTDLEGRSAPDSSRTLREAPPAREGLLFGTRLAPSASSGLDLGRALVARKTRATPPCFRGLCGESFGEALFPGSLAVRAVSVRSGSDAQALLYRVQRDAKT